MKRHHSPAPQAQKPSPIPRDGTAWLYGVHAVTAAWTNPERQIRRLVVTDSGLEAMQSAMAEAARLGLPRPSPTKVERRDLDRLLGDAVHQGLALDAAPLPEGGIEELCVLAPGRPASLIVILDQVTDPHNIGAILRSASAFGADAVVVTERHAPEITGVLAKTASGALEHVPLVRAGNLARAIEQLQQAGYWCVGLAESGQRTLGELDLSSRVALVLGAEGPGLRRLTMERCDEIVRLPTQGAIASLNVSNAAAVAMYEAARRR